MEETNVLNLNKLQIHVIKTHYKDIKPILTKRDKAIKKFEAAKEKFEAELKECEEQISVFDTFAKDTTKKTYGKEFTTEECIKILENPSILDSNENTNSEEIIEDTNNNEGNFNNI